MRLDVSGGKDLLRLADALRDAGNRKLGQQLDRGMRNAGQVIADEVERDPDPYIPRGYERAFRGALRHRIEARLARGRRVSVVFFADGVRGNRRHLDQIEAGILRHPVYGRVRRLKSGGVMRNPWVQQRIRPGVITEPGLRAVPKSVRKIQDAANDVAASINI